MQVIELHRHLVILQVIVKEDVVLIVKKDYNQENYLRMGERYLTDYYKRYHPFDQGRLIGLEIGKPIELSDEYKFYMQKVPRANFLLGIIRLLRR